MRKTQRTFGILILLLFVSCSSIKLTVNKPENLPFEIIENIKNQDEWENELIKKLFKKYDIREINKGIALKKEFKQYDKRYRKKSDNFIWIDLQTSNSNDLMFFAYDLKKELNISSENNVKIVNIIDNYERETDIEFHYYWIEDKEQFKQRLFDIMGVPKTETDREITWKLNGYYIKFNKNWNTVTIQLKYSSI